jgi:cyclic lactone autoinducer peptide
MFKKSLQKSISSAIDYVGMKSAEKSLSQSCGFIFYQPKEPLALRIKFDKTNKSNKTQSYN